MVLATRRQVPVARERKQTQLAISTVCPEVLEDLRRDGFARYGRHPRDRFDFVGDSSHMMVFTACNDMEVLLAAGRVTRGGQFTSPIMESTGGTSILPFGPKIAEFTFGVTRPEFRRRGLFTYLRASSVMHAAAMQLDCLTLIVQAAVPVDQDRCAGLNDLTVDPGPSLVRLGFKEVLGREVFVQDADRPLKMRSFLHDLKKPNVELCRVAMLKIQKSLDAVPTSNQPFVWHGPIPLSAGHY